MDCRGRCPPPSSVSRSESAAHPRWMWEVGVCFSFPVFPSFSISSPPPLGHCPLVVFFECVVHSFFFSSQVPFLRSILPAREVGSVFIDPSRKSRSLGMFGILPIDVEPRMNLVHLLSLEGESRKLEPNQAPLYRTPMPPPPQTVSVVRAVAFFSRSATPKCQFSFREGYSDGAGHSLWSLSSN